MNRILIVILLSTINSQISNDSLAVLIEKGKVQILEEVKYLDPLIGKIGGIEINPLYSMFYSGNNKTSFSGTVSFFTKKAEIAFPFSHRYKAEDSLFQNFNSTMTNIDAQYRYFLGKYRKGLYIMGGIRFANYKTDGSYGLPYTKQGLFFGIGYRIFSSSNGLYWGCSLYLGKHYFGSDNGSDGFMNLELLKFGKTF